MNKKIAWILGGLAAFAAATFLWYIIGIRSISGCVVDPRPRPAPPPQGAAAAKSETSKEVFLNETILVTLYQQLFDKKTVTVEIQFSPETKDDILFIAQLGTTAEPPANFLKMQGEPKKSLIKEFSITAEEDGLQVENIKNWNNHGRIHAKAPLNLKSFKAISTSANSAEIQFRAFGIKTGFTLWRGKGINTEPSKAPSSSDLRVAYVKPSRTRIPAGEMLQPVYYYSSIASEERPSLARWEFAIPDDDPHAIELEGKKYPVKAGTVVIEYELDSNTKTATAQVYNNNDKIAEIPQIATHSTAPDITNISVQAGQYDKRTAALVFFETFGTTLHFLIIAKDMRNRPAWTIGFDSP